MRDLNKLRKWHRIKNKKLYDRWRAIGCCGKCGLPIEKYTLCFRHRLINAAATHRWYLRKKARMAKLADAKDLKSFVA